VAPTKNATDDTVPSLSAAVAEMVIVLPATTEAPVAGEVTATVGGTLAAAWQVPLTQLLLWQSPLPRQVFPFAHFALHEPPQSTSVSLPFFFPSLQAGAWQMPPVHTRLSQSAPAAQARPGLQGGQ
jgi:hypothetical protein